MLVAGRDPAPVLPRIPPTTDLSYGGLLRSVLSLIREEPILRQRMMLGALDFGCFSTAVDVAGLPALGTAVSLRQRGDRAVRARRRRRRAAASARGPARRPRPGRRATTVDDLMMLVSWGDPGAGKSSVIALVVGIAVLDLGVQGLHISNQSAIYALRPEARSRLTTAYMVAYFLGGAALSALTSSLYGTDGWSGVCILGAATALLALVVWAVTGRARRGRRSRRTRPYESLTAERDRETRAQAGHVSTDAPPPGSGRAAEHPGRVRRADAGDADGGAGPDDRLDRAADDRR